MFADKQKMYYTILVKKVLKGQFCPIAHERGGGMKRRQLTRLIIAVGLMAVMVATILGVGVWMYLSVKPAPATPAAPQQPSSGALTTSADFQPDRTKLFIPHDGVLLDENGREVSLKAFRGRATVILFWSSWCSDCKEYFAGQLRSCMEAAEKAGAAFVLAAREGMREETHATAEACLAEFGLDCGTMMDPGAELFNAMGLHWVPSMAVLDADGRLMVLSSDMPDADGMTAMIDYACGGMETQTERLLAAMTTSGGIASACVVDKGSLTPQRTILSETQGLMMRYALKACRQPLFDYTLGYVRNSMTRSGLSAWQTLNHEMAGVNASLDDLRLIEALIDAENLWGGYAGEVAYRERALYSACVQNGYFRDFADLASGQPSQTVTLCYQDITAMRSLAQWRQAWNDVADRAVELLTGGIIADEFPLYWPRYDAEEDRYYGELLQMNEAMITVLNAVRAGIAEPGTLDWLEERLAEGYVAAAYTPQGEVVAGYEFESTATYALLVQIGLEADRPQMALAALQRMERLRSFQQPLLGGYGETEGSMLYTFDVIQAMLAWQSWNQAGL